MCWCSRLYPCLQIFGEEVKMIESFVTLFSSTINTQSGTALLYFASTAAQVWAGLLVFSVFFVRDRKQSAEIEISELTLQIQFIWSAVKKDLSKAKIGIPEKAIQLESQSEANLYWAKDFF